MKWIVVINKEMNFFLKNYIWKLIRRFEKERIIGCKWIFKFKLGIIGVEEFRYKVRLVVKGFF